MLLDMLNRPIVKGDTVIVRGYGSTTYVQAIVDKVAKVNIYVRLRAVWWEWDATTNKHRRMTEPEGKRMPRRPNEVIVINEQIAHNKATWPELQI